MKKLSKAQQALVDAMKGGARLHYMAGYDAYCWLTTPRQPRVTSTALALEGMGVIERYDVKANGAKFKLTEEWK